MHRFLQPILILKNSFENHASLNFLQFFSINIHFAKIENTLFQQTRFYFYELSSVLQIPPRCYFHKELNYFLVYVIFVREIKGNLSILFAVPSLFIRWQKRRREFIFIAWRLHFYAITIRDRNYPTLLSHLKLNFECNVFFRIDFILNAKSYRITFLFLFLNIVDFCQNVFLL